MRLLPCSLAAIAGIFSLVALADDAHTAPAVPLQLSASQIEWCPPTTDGGTGRGDHYDRLKYRCVAGHILTPDDDYCPPGNDRRKAKGGKFKPAYYRCEQGHLLNKEQQYCAPRILGDGGAYRPAFEHCLDGYILGPGDDYCYRGAKGPGGTYKVAQQLCDGGKILGITMQIDSKERAAERSKASEAPPKDIGPDFCKGANRSYNKKTECCEGRVVLKEGEQLTSSEDGIHHSEQSLVCNQGNVVFNFDNNARKEELINKGISGQNGDACVCGTIINMHRLLERESISQIDLQKKIHSKCIEARFGKLMARYAAESENAGPFFGNPKFLEGRPDIVDFVLVFSKVDEALKDGRIVAMGVDARPIWARYYTDKKTTIPKSVGDAMEKEAKHSILIIGANFDLKGKVTHYTIVDSGVEGGRGAVYTVPVENLKSAYKKADINSVGGAVFIPLKRVYIKSLFN